MKKIIEIIKTIKTKKNDRHKDDNDNDNDNDNEEWYNDKKYSHHNIVVEYK